MLVSAVIVCILATLSRLTLSGRLDDCPFDVITRILPFVHPDSWHDLSTVNKRIHRDVKQSMIEQFKNRVHFCKDESQLTERIKQWLNDPSQLTALWGPHLGFILGIYPLTEQPFYSDLIRINKKAVSLGGFHLGLSDSWISVPIMPKVWLYNVDAETAIEAKSDRMNPPIILQNSYVAWTEQGFQLFDLNDDDSDDVNPRLIPFRHRQFGFAVRLDGDEQTPKVLVHTVRENVHQLVELDFPRDPHSSDHHSTNNNNEGESEGKILFEQNKETDSSNPIDGWKLSKDGRLFIQNGCIYDTKKMSNHESSLLMRIPLESMAFRIPHQWISPMSSYVAWLSKDDKRFVCNPWTKQCVFVGKGDKFEWINDDIFRLDHRIQSMKQLGIDLNANPNHHGGTSVEPDLAQGSIISADQLSSMGFAAHSSNGWIEHGKFLLKIQWLPLNKDI